jgi:hypothetical protein
LSVESILYNSFAFMPRHKEKVAQIWQRCTVCGKGITQNHPEQSHIKINSEKPAEKYPANQPIEQSNNQTE